MQQCFQLETWFMGLSHYTSDGGIVVDECQRTPAPGVFAAGDACTTERRSSDPAHQWFQMRLWSQVLALSSQQSHLIEVLALYPMPDESSHMSCVFVPTLRGIIKTKTKT